MNNSIIIIILVFIVFILYLNDEEKIIRNETDPDVFSQTLNYAFI